MKPAQLVVSVPAGFATILHDVAVHELVQVWGPSEDNDPGLTWTEEERRERAEMLAAWTRLKRELDAGNERVHMAPALAERIIDLHDENGEEFPTWDLLQAVRDANTPSSRKQALERLNDWVEFVNSMQSIDLWREAVGRAWPHGETRPNHPEERTR